MLCPGLTHWPLDVHLLGAQVHGQCCRHGSLSTHFSCSALDQSLLLAAPERQRDPPARIDYLWSNLQPLQVELVRSEPHFSDHLGVRGMLRCDGVAQSAAMQ